MKVWDNGEMCPFGKHVGSTILLGAIPARGESLAVARPWSNLL